MSKPFTIKTWGAIGVLVVALAAFVALGGCKNQPDKDDDNAQGQAQKGPAQISVENGETVITLDAPTQTRLGLSVAALGSTESRAQQAFPAVVLSIEDLATFRNGYLAAQGQLQKARVEADVANKEYTRLKILYADDQNVSQKSLESAEGTVQTDQTDVTAAEQQVNLQKSLIGQRWGSAVEDWTQHDSPSLERVLDQRDALVQMTVPADTALAAPKSISVENLDGTRTEASLVSAFPRVDARVQGRSFLYVMSPRSPVAPETSLLAHVPVGGEMKGVVVPTTAVVWSEGRAWVYQQSGASQFTRREVPTDLPLANGYFVSKGLATEEKIVTVGAQALLSEEFLLRGASAGENDD